MARFAYTLLGLSASWVALIGLSQYVDDAHARRMAEVDLLRAKVRAVDKASY